VLVTSSKDYGRGVVRILVIWEETERGFYALKSVWGDRKISDNGLVGHIREKAKGKYQLSLVTEKGKVLELIVSQFASDINIKGNGSSKPKPKPKPRRDFITSDSPKDERVMLKDHEGRRKPKKNNQRSPKKRGADTSTRKSVKPAADVRAKKEGKAWPKNSAMEDAMKALGYKKQ